MLTLSAPQFVGLAIVSLFIGRFVRTRLNRSSRSECRLPATWRYRSDGAGWILGDLVAIGCTRSPGRISRVCETVLRAHCPILEITFLLAALLTTVFLPAQKQLSGAIFAWLLLALSWWDGCERRLPDSLNSVLWVGGLLEAANGGALISGLIGSMAGFLASALIAGMYRNVRDRSGLGYGDIKLFGAVGAWLGWYPLPVMFLLSSAGALSFMVLNGQVSRAESISFGPFIAAAAWITWVFMQSGS